MKDTESDSQILYFKTLLPVVIYIIKQTEEWLLIRSNTINWLMMGALLQEIVERLTAAYIMARNNQYNDGKEKPDTKPASLDKPPIRIDTALHLAWGLTLGLSHDSVQTTLVQQIKERFLKDFSYKDDINAQYYIDNLIAYFASYLRSMGFEKSVYDNYLDIQKDTRDKKIEAINELAEFTSFSSEGVVIKVATFLGFGSLAELLRNFFLQPTQAYSNLVDTISVLSEQIKVNPSTAQDLSDAISSLAQASAEVRESQTLPVEIGWILVFGFASLIGITYLFKAIRAGRIRAYMKETYDKQQKYWEAVARPNYITSLVHLYEDIRSLAERTYPDYIRTERGQENEEILKGPKQVYAIIEDIVPRKLLYVRSRFVFRWSDIPGNEEKTLKEYLKQEFRCYWIDNFRFEKSDDDMELCAIPMDATVGRQYKDHTLSIERFTIQRYWDFRNKNQREEAELELDGRITRKFKVMKAEISETGSNRYIIDVFEQPENL